MKNFTKILFLAIVLILWSKTASAQSVNFHQTGKICAIISEIESKTPSWKNTAHDVGAEFVGVADSKVQYYFTYSVIENGAAIEKWAALPEDEKWSELSDKKVSVKGELKGNKLTVADIVLLEPASKTSAVAPTTGLYKIVAVLLNIQPPSAKTDSIEHFADLTVTAEQIRSHLFDAPNSTAKFYREASYGKLNFTGVHHPQVDVVPVTIRTTIGNNCQDQIINEFTPVVRQKLLEQNINTMNGSVDLGVIILNDVPGCPPYPISTRGALGARGTPQWVWMPESWFTPGPLILTHEIAHNFGGNHPYALRCTNFDDPQTCVSVMAHDRGILTYNTPFYLMPDNYDRRRFGWHPPGVFDNPFTEFAATYDLRSTVLPFVKDGLRSGRFYFRRLGGNYAEWDVYPEGKQNWGQFEKYSEQDEAYRRGIAVRIGHANYTDAEALAILLESNTTSDFDDAPLRENQQLTIGGMTIKCLKELGSATGTRMRVE